MRDDLSDPLPSGPLYCNAGCVCDNQDECPWFTSPPVTDQCGVNCSCPIGYYCPEGKQTKYLCPEGTTSDGRTGGPGSPGAKTADDCYQCPKGQYCIPGQERRPCPIGTYQPNYGAVSTSDCKDCDPGYYCKYSYAEQPTGVCEAGYYCPSKSIEPRPCPEDMYCPEQSNNPIECPGGYFCTTAGREPCRAGSYCPAGTMGSQQQLQCPLNSYCPERSSNPLVCPGGGLTETSGAVSISDCAGGVKSGISKAGLAFAILIPLLLLLLLIFCICRYRRGRNKKKQKPHQTQSAREVGYPEDTYGPNISTRTQGQKNVAFTSTTTMSSDVLPSNVERRFDLMNKQEKVYSQQFTGAPRNATVGANIVAKQSRSMRTSSSSSSSSSDTGKTRSRTNKPKTKYITSSSPPKTTKKSSGYSQPFSYIYDEPNVTQSQLVREASQKTEALNKPNFQSKQKPIKSVEFPKRRSSSSSSDTSIERGKTDVVIKKATNWLSKARKTSSSSNSSSSSDSDDKTKKMPPTKLIIKLPKSSSSSSSSSEDEPSKKFKFKMPNVRAPDVGKPSVKVTTKAPKSELVTVSRTNHIPTYTTSSALKSPSKTSLSSPDPHRKIMKQLQSPVPIVASQLPTDNWPLQVKHVKPGSTPVLEARSIRSEVLSQSVTRNELDHIIQSKKVKEVASVKYIDSGQ